MRGSAAHLVFGVEAAGELAGDDKFAPFCERMIKWMGEIPSGKSNPLVEIQTVWLTDFGPEEMKLLLDLSLLWLRDLFKCVWVSEEIQCLSDGKIRSGTKHPAGPSPAC